MRPATTTRSGLQRHPVPQLHGARPGPAPLRRRSRRRGVRVV